MVLRKVFSSATLLIAAVLLLLTGTSPAFAASSLASSNGLRVSPVRSDLTIKPGESQTIDVYVTNLTNGEADIKAVADDFTANPDESGTPAILLNGEKAPAHSLKGFVTPIGNFTIPPKGTKNIKVTVAIPQGTPGGGYYAAIRFLPATTDDKGKKNVNLTASVGSLLLVTVPGPYKEQVTLSSFDVRQRSDNGKMGQSSYLYTNNKNLYGVVRFNNTGDVQEEPFGKMQLKKGGKVIATYEINDTTPRGNVLPDSIRRFSVKLTGLGSIGKYTLEGNFGYGNKGQLLSASTTFYIIPIWILVIIGILILLIILGIFMIPKMLRKYNRGVINKASRNARR
ncbi:MAG TPA: hypothetical protein VLG47_07385 [Candidatus Saccharimonadales bacterium]|nr:hypothetical protein [Candidatus Saccharimonadales bacterium]